MGAAGVGVGAASGAVRAVPSGAPRGPTSGVFNDGGSGPYG